MNVNKTMGFEGNLAQRYLTEKEKTTADNTTGKNSVFYLPDAEEKKREGKRSHATRLRSRRPWEKKKILFLLPHRGLIREKKKGGKTKRIGNAHF